MSATVQCPRGAMERACHAFDQMAWPCRVQPPRHVEGIEYIMWRIGDAQTCERHRQKAQVKGALWGTWQMVTALALCSSAHTAGRLATSAAHGTARPKDLASSDAPARE